MNMNDIATSLLESNNYCVLATVCEDGAPWATPVHFAYDAANIYWLSHDDTVHSNNIARDSRVFIIVFDSRQSPETPNDKGAVYISTLATKLSDQAAMTARDIYADRYPDEDNRKLAQWSVYAAPIGTVDETKSIGRMIYYQQKEGISE